MKITQFLVIVLCIASLASSVHAQKQDMPTPEVIEKMIMENALSLEAFINTLKENSQKQIVLLVDLEQFLTPSFTELEPKVKKLDDMHRLKKNLSEQAKMKEKETLLTNFAQLQKPSAELVDTLKHLLPYNLNFIALMPSLTLIQQDSTHIGRMYKKFNDAGIDLSTHVFTKDRIEITYELELDPTHKLPILNIYQDGMLFAPAMMLPIPTVLPNLLHMFFEKAQYNPDAIYLLSKQGSSLIILKFSDIMTCQQAVQQA